MRKIDLEFVRAQFPAFAEPSLARLGFFENAGRLIRLPGGGRTPERVLPPAEGATLLRLPRFARSGGVDGCGAHAPRRVPERVRGGGPLRSLDLAEHVRARPGVPPAAGARRRGHRHQPGSRGQQRRMAAPGAGPRDGQGMARRSRERRPRSGRPRPADQRAHAARRLLALLQRRRAHQSGGARSRRRRTPPAPSPWSTASRTRRTACPTSTRSARTSTCSRCTRPTGPIRA